MRRKFRIFSAIMVVLGAIAGPASLPAQESFSGSTSARPEAVLEGTVKKINPATGTVIVSIGKYGLWSKTLEVNYTTDIRIEGRKASLEDLEEGEKVKASYETLVGKSFATSIEVTAPTETP
jgi:Cu/Ag efflux protein CusF